MIKPVTGSKPDMFELSEQEERPLALSGVLPTKHRLKLPRTCNVHTEQPGKTSTPFPMLSNKLMTNVSGTPALRPSGRRRQMTPSSNMSPYVVSPIVSLEKSFGELSFPKEINSMFEETHNDSAVISDCLLTDNDSGQKVNSLVSQESEIKNGTGVSSARGKRSDKHCDGSGNTKDSSHHSENNGRDNSEFDSGFPHCDSKHIEASQSSNVTGSHKRKRSSNGDHKKSTTSASYTNTYQVKPAFVPLVTRKCSTRPCVTVHSTPDHITGSDCEVVDVKLGKANPRLFNSSVHRRSQKKRKSRLASLDDVEPSDSSHEMVEYGSGSDHPDMSSDTLSQEDKLIKDGGLMVKSSKIATKQSLKRCKNLTCPDSVAVTRQSHHLRKGASKMKFGAVAITSNSKGSQQRRENIEHNVRNMVPKGNIAAVSCETEYTSDDSIDTEVIINIKGFRSSEMNKCLKPAVKDPSQGSTSSHKLLANLVERVTDSEMEVIEEIEEAKPRPHKKRRKKDIQTEKSQVPSVHQQHPKQKCAAVNKELEEDENGILSAVDISDDEYVYSVPLKQLRKPKKPRVHVERQLAPLMSNSKFASKMAELNDIAINYELNVE